MEIAADPKGIDMTCNSCGKVYHVTQEEVQDLLANNDQEQSSEQAQVIEP